VRTDGASVVVGGVAAADLAAAYGTPLLALDTDVLDANLERFARAGARTGIDVCYAGKALLFVELARRIAATPLGIDVCSLGELLTAERAQVSAERLVLHGCGKTDAELEAAASGRVGRVVVDNATELERLAALASRNRPIRVLLRVNTGIEVRTHAYVRTGGEDSKFGFAREDIDAVIATALASPGLQLTGVHSHLGSQIFDPEPFAASVDVVMEMYERMARAGGRVEEIVLGGGFGVDARPGGERLDLESTLETVARAARDDAKVRGLPRPRIGIEPGRAIVADAGTSLYRVVAVKRHGSRRFAIVDGGIADNPRPALYGAYHHPRLANRDGSADEDEFTVCGRSCENDRLVVARLPQDLVAGDLLALETTGAYTYSMASNYNRFPKPAVVFAGAGRHRLVVRRERDDDLLRNDVDGSSGP
jgi:diaminopimelate decarboxylase